MSPEYEKFASLFFPRHLQALRRVSQENGRFAHYTSATVAMSIMQKPYVWMRNALTMNDFSEMRHGRDCIIPAYNSSVGEQFKALLNSIYPNLTKTFEGRFNEWLPDFEQNTFLTSLSLHSASEDKYGRLSMWRAYGQKNGVALILRNTPFLAETDSLKALSSVVSYMTPGDYLQSLTWIVNNLTLRRQELAELSFDQLLDAVFVMFKTDMLCTKHPGFHEEQEWRIFYSPGSGVSEAIEPSFEVVGGIPQKIYKIPLRHDPDAGLVGADLNQLLDRIIIGPTHQPLTMWNTFVELLHDAGVTNPAERVFISDIPLRT